MSSLAGTFLVARASLRDGFFARSVILLLEHDENGAFGLVLNRPATTDKLPFPIFIGGPCERDGFRMIHGEPDWLDASDDHAEICPGVYMGTQEQFEKAIEAGGAAATRFRLFAHYAGWGPEQLETEMNEGSWIVRPAHGDILFGTPVEDLWERLAPHKLPEPSLN
jgi:putative transcriptional regulator